MERKDGFWEEYASSFEKFDESVLNDFESELHNMKVKKGLFKQTFQSPKYVEVAGKICVDFDSTNFDLVNYEKEFLIGESD